MPSRPGATKMPKFSETSASRLSQATASLQVLFDEVVKSYDCTILEGHRGRQEQQRAYNTGKSKVDWPNSKHNLIPAKAVDAAPYPIPERWGDHPNPKVLARFYHFAGYVLCVAQRMAISIRWGGDWDGDHDFRDQTFDDLVHFEEM